MVVSVVQGVVMVVALVVVMVVSVEVDPVVRVGVVEVGVGAAEQAELSVMLLPVAC